MSLFHQCKHCHRNGPFKIFWTLCQTWLPGYQHSSKELSIDCEPNIICYWTLHGLWRRKICQACNLHEDLVQLTSQGRKTYVANVLKEVAAEGSPCSQDLKNLWNSSVNSKSGHLDDNFARHEVVKHGLGYIDKQTDPSENLNRKNELKHYICSAVDLCRKFNIGKYLETPKREAQPLVKISEAIRNELNQYPYMRCHLHANGTNYLTEIRLHLDEKYELVRDEQLVEKWMIPKGHVKKHDQTKYYTNSKKLDAVYDICNENTPIQDLPTNNSS